MHLRLRLADRPEPRGVDVRVADGDGAVAARHVECRIGETEQRRDDPRGGGDVGEPVERGFERPQQLHPTRVVEPEGAHHAVEHLEVVGERLGVGVDDDELGRRNR